MKITLDLPESVASRLPKHRGDAARVVAARLRRKESVLETEFAGIMRKLSKPLPPREILRLRLSAVAQARVDDLLAKGKNKGLSRAEEQEWRFFEMADHLVRMAKLKAAEEVGVPGPA
jgi:hypothetical protein